MTEIGRRLAEVRARIAEASVRAGRAPDAVRIVAVSKTHPVSAIEEAYAAGQIDFGENYVQEWRAKMEDLAHHPSIRWHLIGPIQSNKVAVLDDRVALIHTVDRPSLVEALVRGYSAPRELLVQVNVAGEATKSGCAPASLDALVSAICARSALRLRGLMTIPPYSDDPEEARPHFRRLRELFERTRERLAEVEPERAFAFDTLSMGMSHDAEVAVEEGATLVRIGTAIFGTRTPGRRGG